MQRLHSNASHLRRASALSRRGGRPRRHPPHTASSGTRSGLHPRSASFSQVALVPSDSASLRMTSQQFSRDRRSALNWSTWVSSTQMTKRPAASHCGGGSFAPFARPDYGVGDRGDGDADHGSHHTTTERLRPETSISGTPTRHVLARRRGRHFTARRPRSRRVVDCRCA
jgi:hypothetical protein